MRGAGAFTSGPSPYSRCLSWVSHCLCAPASVYVMHSPIPRLPGLLSHSLSDLNLVTDFCILSSSCVTNPSSLAAYKEQFCSVSAHARLRTVHGVWQPSALETLNSQDCLSRGELCEAPSIHFNTCVSWRFQNGLITVSNCSGIPRETGRLDGSWKTQGVQGGVSRQWGNYTTRRINKEGMLFALSFWQTLAVWRLPLGLLF